MTLLCFYPASLAHGIELPGAHCPIGVSMCAISVNEPLEAKFSFAFDIARAYKGVVVIARRMFYDATGQ